MITAKSFFYFFLWMLFITVIFWIAGMLFIETFSSIVGLSIMDKAGLAKDTSNLMWSWIQIKPFVLLGLVSYIVFFSKPCIPRINLRKYFIKEDKPKDV